MKRRGMSTPEQYAQGDVPWDVAGVAGNVAGGVAGLAKSGATTVLQRVREGAKLGAAFGASQPGAEDITSNLEGAAGGAVLGAAAPFLIPPVAKTAGWLWDAAGGRLVQVQAGKVLRDIAGPQLEQLTAAMKAAPSDATAAQAAFGIPRDVWQAFGSMVRKKDTSSFYRMKGDAEAVARQSALKGVTPDLAAAEAARDAAKQVAYGRATAADTQRLQMLAEEARAGNQFAGATGYVAPSRGTPALQALEQDPIIKAAAAAALKNNPSLGNPMESLEGLHYMKLAIDSQFKQPLLPTALQSFDKLTLQSAKQRLLDAIEGTANQPGISPLYGVARKQYAAMSPEVNQAKLLGEMSNVLASPAGGEQSSAFLGALGRGENALIKRSDQSPRFGGVQDILTPNQMATVTDINNQLVRDSRMAAQAAEGTGGLNRILGEDTVNLKLPSYLSAVASSANWALAKLQGKLDQRTLDALIEGMKTGKSAAKLLETLPAKDRSEVMRVLTQAKWNPAVNALAAQNQNSLTKE
jgi:hypothetical protein